MGAPLTASLPSRLGVVSPFSAPTPTAATGHASVGLRVVQVLCNIASAVIYLAPIPSFWRIRQAAATAGYDVTPHLVTLVCCLFWGSYGVLKSPVADTTIVIAINFVGATFQIFYIIVFLYYSARPSQILVGGRVFGGLAVYSIIFGFTFLIHGDSRFLAVEVIAAVFSVGISVALTAPVVRAWRDRDVHHMSLPLTCAVVVSQSLWTIFGRLTSDWVLEFPNAFGCFIGLLQIAVFCFVRYRYGPGGAQIELPVVIHVIPAIQAPAADRAIQVVAGGGEEVVAGI